ncbi:hypothetical protein [Corallococcus terminator]|uniref:Uncharacterized protein n=1 Tax=Corallococcus terminator TaxID=2316733 RepID=A0A3A8JBM1_9BACT|nr:hypothetical protein [Corallococcus terminator]RKG93079.1 hypothetical protein D7V88_03835 [Corallococcus terminator]
MKRILPLILAAFAVACAGPDFQDTEASNDAVQVSSEEAALAQTIVVCGLCPPGYTRVSSTCSTRCNPVEFPCLPRLGNESTCAPIPSGTVTANPTTVRINTNVTTVGTTNVCWSVTNATTGEVWVSMNGQPESLMSRGPSGCVSVPWIYVGSSYDFRLYAETAHATLLNTVTVVGQAYTPPPCGPCATGYSCFCGDRVCRREGTLCP